MDNDEQRDYAEEEYNRRLLIEEQEDCDCEDHTDPLNALTPDEIEICQDCLFILANGEGPDDVAEALAKRWPVGTITLGRITDPDDPEGFFSSSPCDGCGSTLGGDRYYATGWTE